MSDEKEIRGEPVKVEPERHDDDHPDKGGRVGGPATGTPGVEQGERKSVLDAIRKAVEPKPRTVSLPDDADYQISSGEALIELGAMFERLIERLPTRVEIAPSEEISTLQIFLPSGVPFQVVGKQPDRVRLQVTYRTAADPAPSVYIGRQGVTVGSGREIVKGETVVLDTRSGVYAIASDTGARLDVLIEIGDR